MEYLPRLIDKEIDEISKVFGAIQILGPKGCGKTTTAKERVKTAIYFEDEDKRASLLKLADASPSRFLEYERPILFDEWQDAPKIWGTIRKACDDDDLFGEFYLTGSSSQKVSTPHTGTLRIASVRMLNMSLFESGDSNGRIPLSDLFFNNCQIDGIKSDLTLSRLFHAACRGGYPRTCAVKNDNAKLLVAKEASKSIYDDVASITNAKINRDWLSEILKSYARNIGTIAKKSVLVNDATANFVFSEDTFDRYVEALKELYIISDIDAWTPNIRSKTSMRASKKHLFYEPALVAGILNIGPDYFLSDFDLFGHLFESLVYRDLLVYAQRWGGKVYHYKDESIEIDFVLRLQDGRYALIEVKLGSKEINEAVNNLNRFVDLIEKNNANPNKLKVRKPDLLMIVTGGEYAYTQNNVKVVPIGCLKD